jgi:hypothetical protein
MFFPFQCSAGLLGPEAGAGVVFLRRQAQYREPLRFPNRAPQPRQRLTPLGTEDTRPATAVSGSCLPPAVSPSRLAIQAIPKSTPLHRLFWAPGEYPVAVDRTIQHEIASLRSRPGARHRICSAGAQCLRVVVRTEPVVRTRTARRGLCRARRWVLVGQNVVPLPLASGLECRLARRSAAELV